MSKGLEALKDIGLVFDKDKCDYVVNCNKENYSIIEKQLKALEIIKTKRVDVEYFLAIVRKYDDKFMGWYNQKNIVFAYLTKEEYELLKEVLCE